MALWGLSGATTIILPSPFTASTKLRIPGAVIPSSLVIKMVGNADAFAIQGNYI